MLQLLQSHSVMYRPYTSLVRRETCTYNEACMWHLHAQSDPAPPSTILPCCHTLAQVQVQTPPPTPPQPEGNWICPSYANTNCWDDYQPSTILGRGGFGITYKAIKKDTGEAFAVKVRAVRVRVGERSVMVRAVKVSLFRVRVKESFVRVRVDRVGVVRVRVRGGWVPSAVAQKVQQAL